MKTSSREVELRESGFKESFSFAFELYKFINFLRIERSVENSGSGIAGRLALEGSRDEFLGGLVFAGRTNYICWCIFYNILVRRNGE